MKSIGFAEPLADKLHVLLRCRDADGLAHPFCAYITTTEAASPFAVFKGWGTTTACSRHRQGTVVSLIYPGDSPTTPKERHRTSSFHHQ
jgi:hypothetical protein